MEHTFEVIPQNVDKTSAVHLTLIGLELVLAGGHYSKTALDIGGTTKEYPVLAIVMDR